MTIHSGAVGYDDSVTFGVHPSQLAGLTWVMLQFSDEYDRPVAYVVLSWFGGIDEQDTPEDRIVKAVRDAGTTRKIHALASLDNTTLLLETSRGSTEVG